MAQNEMRAKPALPERVRSMEGLGGCVLLRARILLAPMMGERCPNAERQCVGRHSALLTEDNGAIALELELSWEESFERFYQAGLTVEVDRILARR